MASARAQKVLQFLQREARAELVRGGYRFQRHMQTRRLSGPTTPASLSVRTGQLRRSVRHEVVQTGQLAYTLIGAIGQGVPYARVHEFGGVIRPKKAKNLAIPLQSGSRTAFGPRAFPGQLKFIKSKRGSKLLVQMLGKGKIKPVFVLKDQVQIPARLGFRVTFNAEARITIRNLRTRLRTVIMRGNR